MKITDSHLNDLGYAIVVRNLLMNSKVSCGAKGFYAYLCGYAGTTRLAFPSLAKIKEELALSKSTVYKYADELVENNYILTMNHERKFNVRKTKHYFIRLNKEKSQDEREFQIAINLSFKRAKS